MTSNDLFARLPEVPSFTVTSTSVQDGHALPPAQLSRMFGVPGGRHASPQPAWSGAPNNTNSAPPAGQGPHRYIITVHELDIEDVGIPAESTPALLGSYYGLAHPRSGHPHWNGRNPSGLVEVTLSVELFQDYPLAGLPQNPDLALIAAGSTRILSDIMAMDSGCL